MANTTELIHTIHGLRAMLETLEAQLSGGKAAPVSKAPAVEKPKRVASDALKAWNAYVDQVKADMIATAWTHPESGKPPTRKDAMQEAKARRDTDPNAYKPKPKEAKPAKPTEAAPEPSSPIAETGSEVKAKPKRTLSEEQKAKMAAGRKAAAERRKAEKAAAEASVEPKKVTFSMPPLPASDDEEEDEAAVEVLSPINIKARKYLLNTETNGCWKRNADGSKGEWAGMYDPANKEIDDSIGEEDM